MTGKDKLKYRFLGDINLLWKMRIAFAKNSVQIGPGVLKNSRPNDKTSIYINIYKYTTNTSFMYAYFIKPKFHSYIDIDFKIFKKQLF